MPESPKCPECDGSGRDMVPDPLDASAPWECVPCSECDGTGVVPLDRAAAGDSGTGAARRPWFVGRVEARMTGPSKRDPAVEAAMRRVSHWDRPVLVEDDIRKIIAALTDPALGPHALVRLGDVLAPVDAAIEELEAGFAAQWPSGKRPPVHDDGWMHFGSALDHLRDVRRDYEGRL
jgi:hypothetical protein